MFVCFVAFGALFACLCDACDLCGSEFAIPVDLICFPLGVCVGVVFGFLVWWTVFCFMFTDLLFCFVCALLCGFGAMLGFGVSGVLGL